MCRPTEGIFQDRSRRLHAQWVPVRVFYRSLVADFRWQVFEGTGFRVVGGFGVEVDGPEI